MSDIHPSDEEALQSIDAAVFTGNLDVVIRERLTYFMARWQKALSEPMKPYQFCFATGRDELEAWVIDRLNEGYELHGETQALMLNVRSRTTGLNTNSDWQLYLTQAVVLPRSNAEGCACKPTKQSQQKSSEN